MVSAGLMSARSRRLSVARHLVEPRQIRGDVEIGILLAGDQQRGFGQIDLFVRAGDDLPETLGLRRHARLASGRFSSRFCGFMRSRLSG